MCYCLELLSWLFYSYIWLYDEVIARVCLFLVNFLQSRPALWELSPPIQNYWEQSLPPICNWLNVKASELCWRICTITDTIQCLYTEFISRKYSIIIRILDLEMVGFIKCGIRVFHPDPLWNEAFAYRIWKGPK